MNLEIGDVIESNGNPHGYRKIVQRSCVKTETHAQD